MKNVSVRQHWNGESCRYVVTWTPEPNDRRRAYFATMTEATKEAARIEAAMAKAESDLSTPTLRKEVRTALMLRDQLAPGMALSEIVKAYFKGNEAAEVANAILLAPAAAAFIASKVYKAPRTQSTVRQHINRFLTEFEGRPLAAIAGEEIETYLADEIGGVGKTRKQHLITLRNFFRWSRDKKQWLPWGRPTAPELVDAPAVLRGENEVYTPEEVMRVLAATPAAVLPFMLLGQFAGIRAEERLRLKWSHWRAEEDNKLVLNEDVTKTKRRRRVDVLPNLNAWLRGLRGAPDEHIVLDRNPFRNTKRIFAAAGVQTKPNAFRAGFASYHIELFDNIELTAKLDGHSVEELKTSYQSISNVTKDTARAMFAITPSAVRDFAQQQNLPPPDWLPAYP